MSRIYTSFYTLAWIILAIVFGWAVAPTVETAYFPVYSKFHVENATQTSDGVLATFSFEKLRECKPMGLSWYIGEVGPSTAVNVSAPDGVRTPRPVGPGFSSPYLIEGITLDDLDNNVIAQLRNQCADNWFGIDLPWVTVTEVYPPD